MYPVCQTLVHISNKVKDKLLESGDPYDYKLEDFHFYIWENLMEPYQAVWKKYQQACFQKYQQACFYALYRHKNKLLSKHCLANF